MIIYQYFDYNSIESLGNTSHHLKISNFNTFEKKQNEYCTRTTESLPKASNQ